MTFALTMIVRNELDNLIRMSSSFEKFDQVVIVDTGSDDGTLEYLESLPNVHVVRSAWNDDFSAARNEGLKHVVADTFIWLDADDYISPELVDVWRGLAEKHLTTADDSGKVNTHIVMDYQYSFDEYGNCELSHPRERICRSDVGFFWTNPVHEILCSTEDKHVRVAESIIHMRSSRVDPDRNFKILQKWQKAEPDNTTVMYYLQKEYLARKNLKESASCGLKYLNSGPKIKHILYDVYLWLGCASEDIQEAQHYFNEAITLEPGRNEAKIECIKRLLHTSPMESMQLLESLSETPAETYGPISVECYGPSMLAFKSNCYLTLGMVQEALEVHTQTLYRYVSMTKSNFSQDVILRRHLQDNDIGLVVCSRNKIEKAQEIALTLEIAGLFSKVVVSACLPTAMFANKYLVTVSDNPEDISVVDTPPGVRKIWFTDSDCQIHPGYTKVKDVGEMMDALFYNLTKVRLVNGLSEFEVTTKVRSVRTRYTLIQLFEDSSSRSDMLEQEVREVVERQYSSTADGAIIVVKDSAENVVALLGTTEKINSLPVSVDENSTINFWLIEDMKIIVVNLGGEAYSNPTVVGIQPLPVKNKTVAFYAGGLEPWSGVTPYQIGIGASESSLINLAEEFVKAGWDTSVYNTTTHPVVVGGVRYLPSKSMPKNKLWDVFISSRSPDVLSLVDGAGTPKRLGKTQVFWMHDLPEVYKGFFEQPEDVCRETAANQSFLADYYVCVSSWHKMYFQAFKNLMGAKNNVAAIYNIVKERYPKNGSDTRIGSVWSSSADRGLDLLLSSLPKDTACDKLPVHVLYGLHNMYQTAVYKKDLRMFQKVCDFRVMCLSAGVHFWGRVNAGDVYNVMCSAEYWPYFSDFKETMCVSAVEAVACGLKPITTLNGAVPEVLSECVMNYEDSVKEVDLAADKISQACIAKLDNVSPITDLTSFSPKSIFSQWMQLIEGSLV